MATDPRKRQKKLAKRAAQRKEKKHQLVKKQNVGMAEQVEQASRYPILDCLVTDSIWDNDIGHVWVSRQLPDGRVVFVNFLVDMSCLGVKNALAHTEGRFSYDGRLANFKSKLKTSNMRPEDARKLVEGAVEFARSAGLSPHPDYHKCKGIFGDIDASASDKEYEYGKDGKPFFVSGPHDTPERCKQIINTLLRHCGPGNFDYLIIVDDPSRYMPEQFKSPSPLLEAADDQLIEPAQDEEQQ